MVLITCNSLCKCLTRGSEKHSLVAPTVCSHHLTSRIAGWDRSCTGAVCYAQRASLACARGHDDCFMGEAAASRTLHDASSKPRSSDFALESFITDDNELSQTLEKLGLRIADSPYTTVFQWICSFQHDHNVPGP